MRTTATQPKRISDPFIIGIFAVGSEKACYYDAICDWFFTKVTRVSTMTFDLDGKNFSFVLKLFKGDLNFLRKLLGSNVNGIFRCSWCSISMDATDMISFRFLDFSGFEEHFFD